MRYLDLNISEEMLIMPYLNGVKLETPTTTNQHLQSIKSLFELPSNLFFLDRSCRIICLNETAIQTCNYPGFNKTVGNTLHIAARQKEADFIINQDAEVYDVKRTTYSEYTFVRHDHDRFSAFAIRYPLYNELDNSIVGMFSISMLLGQNSPVPFGIAFAQFVEKGLLSPSTATHISTKPSFGQFATKYGINKREWECLTLLMQSYSAKMIAKTLGLSPRSVEYYLANAKDKLGVRYKHQLINLLQNQGQA